jgi:hypothetical protein
MYKYTSELQADELGTDVKKSNSSNETPNVMTVGVEKYGLSPRNLTLHQMRLFSSLWETLLCFYAFYVFVETCLL